MLRTLRLVLLLHCTVAHFTTTESLLLRAGGCCRESICRRTPTLPCCRMMLCVLHAAECSIRRVAAAYADANMCFLTGGTLISALLFAPLCLTP